MAGYLKFNKNELRSLQELANSFQKYDGKPRRVLSIDGNRTVFIVTENGIIGDGTQVMFLKKPNLANPRPFFGHHPGYIVLRDSDSVQWAFHNFLDLCNALPKPEWIELWKRTSE